MVLDGFIFPVPDVSYGPETFPAKLIRLPGRVVDDANNMSGEDDRERSSCAPRPGGRERGSGGYNTTYGNAPNGLQRTASTMRRTASGRAYPPRRHPALYVKPAHGTSRFMLLFLHANATDLGNMEAEAQRMADRLRCTVLMPEYPGYGLYTSKKASMQAINEAAWAAFTFATEFVKVPASRIIIYGRSIGTGVAVHLAARAAREGNAVRGVCLVSPYTSLLAVVRDHVSCAASIFAHRWQLMKEAPGVSAPLLIIHGQQDVLIKPQHSLELITKLKGSHSAGSLRDDEYTVFGRDTGGTYEWPIAVRLAALADHNRWRYNEDIITPLERFINEVCTVGPAASIKDALQVFDHLPYLWAER